MYVCGEGSKKLPSADFQKISFGLVFCMFGAFGGSRKSTFRHPFLPLAANVTICSPDAISCKIIFPESWNKFSSQVNLKNTNYVQKLLSAYKLLLHNPDPKVHIPAAFSWTNYENECANFNTKSDKILSEDHKKALALARIENHYFLNDMFLKPFEILNNVDGRFE